MGGRYSWVPQGALLRVGALHRSGNFMNIYILLLEPSLLSSPHFLGCWRQTDTLQQGDKTSHSVKNQRSSRNKAITVTWGLPPNRSPISETPSRQVHLYAEVILWHQTDTLQQGGKTSHSVKNQRSSRNKAITVTWGLPPNRSPISETPSRQVHLYAKSHTLLLDGARWSTINRSYKDRGQNKPEQLTWRVQQLYKEKVILE